MTFNQSELDEIAEAFSVEVRRGLAPSVDEVVAEHGDDPTLRELLESIVMIESIKRDSQLTPSREHGSINCEQLDDYRLIREIGRGGMGLVFEAEDQSLHRRVAIKVLPNSLLDDQRNLERFRSEAAAAARLRHPNIVSVLGVGFAENHHYYVMDYIAGVNLKQWLTAVFRQASEEVPTLHSQADSNATFEVGSQPSADAKTALQIVKQASIPTQIHSPDYSRWVAGVGQAVCEALHYAHSQSILHRDIKPANLLLDTNGNLLLADFGLAKVAGNVDMTRTGDVMGTPQYMAPESLSGEHDVRSEVYAVGLTLYELLTTVPAISSTRTAEVIRLAAQGVRTKPSKWNPHIPRALETIVLKSLAFDPADRYGDTSELAADLENFLANRPINARKSSLPERIYRWSKREPLVASLSALTLGSLFTLALVSGIAFFRTRAALTKANQSQAETLQALQDRSEALAAAESQRERAELNLSVAVKAFDEIQEKIWQRGMLPDAEFLGEGVETASSAASDSDAEVLRTLLGFFDELAETNAGAAKVESAAAARRMGDIYQILGQLPEAQRAYANASSRYRELTAQDTDEYVVERAKLLNEQIIVASLRGQVVAASSFFQEVRKLLESDPTVASTPAGKLELARSNLLFATILARAGVEPMTLKRFRHLGPNRRPSLARGINTRLNGEWEAISLAVSLLSELTDEFPNEPKYQLAMARALREQSVLASRNNRTEEAESQMKQSIETLETMLKQNPESASIRYELARTLSSSEAMSINQIFRIGRADTLSAELLAEFPDLARYQELRARILVSMATNRAWGRIKDADAYLNEALTLWEGLIAAADLPQYRVQKSETLAAMADRNMRTGKRSEARELLQLALEAVGSNHAKNPSPMLRVQQQKLRSKLSRLNERALLGPGNFGPK